jgi:hypothetical protein
MADCGQLRSVTEVSFRDVQSPSTHQLGQWIAKKFVQTSLKPPRASAIGIRRSSSAWRVVTRTALMEAVQGLLSLFVNPSRACSASVEQELAGQLLATLPGLAPGALPLDTLLGAALVNYDRSVESTQIATAMTADFYTASVPGGA